MKIEVMNIAEVTTDTKEQMLQFAEFTAQEAGVYSVVCPKKNMDLTAENVLAQIDVPDRVKEIVEMTKSRFYKYEIWTAATYEIKDPILIGREKSVKKPQYTWEDKYYLLARWGAELEQFSILKEKALDIFQRDCMIKAMKMKSQIDMFLMNPKLFCERAIDRGITTEPMMSFSVVD